MEDIDFYINSMEKHIFVTFSEKQQFSWLLGEAEI